MDMRDLLDELRKKALQNDEIRQALLQTKQEKVPLEAFCAQCQQLGFPIYEMDLIVAGEEFYATMRRSTNGGGENSPKLDGEDDIYELFMAELEQSL